MYRSEALTSCVCGGVLWYVLCVYVLLSVCFCVHLMLIWEWICICCQYLWICVLYMHVCCSICCLVAYVYVCGSSFPLAQIFSQLGYRCQLLLFIFSSRGFVERLVVRRVAGQLLGCCSVSAVTGSQAAWRRLVITLNWNGFVCAQLVSCYSLSALIAADTRLWFV